MFVTIIFSIWLHMKLELYYISRRRTQRVISRPETGGIPVFWWNFSSPASSSPFPCFPCTALVLEDPGSAAPNAAQHEISMQMTHFDFSVNHHCKCQAHYSQILQGVVTSISASRERRFLKGPVFNNAALGCYRKCSFFLMFSAKKKKRRREKHYGELVL